MSKSVDLKIRVISNLSVTQQVLLYQQDIDINVKNYLIAAWEHPHIAPKTYCDVVLPMDIAVSAASDIGSGCMSTRELSACYNTAWEIYNNNNGLDIRESNDPAPGMDTIEVLNKCKTTKFAVVTKDSKPLFACQVRPDFRVNFAIHPKLCVALSDIDIQDSFFDTSTLSKAPVTIDYEGQQYVTIYLDENVSTGLITISYNFEKFL